MNRATGSDPYQAAAHRATVLIGDGCVIRQADEVGRGLRAVAADHRDIHRRVHFRALLDAPPLDTAGGWIHQALERGRALRLPDLRPEALASVGVPVDERIGDVIVIPAPAADTAILALRDRAAGQYSERERHQLEEIAALLGDCVTARDNRRSSAVGEPARPLADEFDPSSLGLVDATSAALWVVDGNGKTRYVNEAASELVGLPAGQLTGVPIFELLGSSVARPRTSFYGRDASDRRLLRADGTTIWVTVTSRPLFDREGTESGALHTLVEVGDRRRREVELRLRLQRTEALLEIAQEAASPERRSELLGKVVSFATEQLGIEFAAVSSFDSGTETVQTLAAAGTDHAAIDPAVEAAATEGLPARSALSAALRSGEPVLVGDYETQTLYDRPAEPREPAVRSAAVVPFAGGTVVLTAYSTRPRALDGESLSLLESLVRLLEPRWAPAR